MRIGIEYTVALKQGGGIGRITRGLIAGVAALDRRNEYVLLHAADAPPGELPAPNFRWQVLPFGERALNILWQRARIPLSVDRFAGALDLLHAPNFTLPPTRAASRIVTIHDLTFLRYPEGAVPNLRAFLTRAVPRSAAAATHIIADSQATREDLLDWLRLPPEKISVVYAGVDKRFRPVTDEARRNQVREKYGLQRPYILGLGTLEPRKNYLGLMRAFAQIGLPDVELVVAGGRGWLDEPILAAAEATANVRLLGFVADDDLPVLYSLASVYCLPSFYEGFGIPCIEAMACGTPVVCSDRPCLPEIVGDAALTVAPDDTDRLAASLRSALEDTNLRQDLVERGLRRAREFPWSRAARDLLDVYESRP